MKEDDAVLNASLIQEDWFPEIKTDVFISHSHMDKELAVAFAGCLYNTFKLTSFIDSCVWGYCDDLLREIDEKYCYNKHKRVFNYYDRNFSTSIVHMILMNALNKMIDKTECLMFLNTNNSVPIKNGIEDKTYSPWIFGELETSRIIRKVVPDVLKNRIADSSTLNEAELKVAFTADARHLYNLNNNLIERWVDTWRKHQEYFTNKDINPLHYLYKISNIIK